MSEREPKWRAVVEIVVHAPDADAVDDLIHGVVEAGDPGERVYTVYTMDVEAVPDA